MGNGGIASQQYMVRAEICALIALPGERGPWYSVNHRVGGLQSQPRLYVEKTNFLPLPRFETLFLGYLVCSLVIILSYLGSCFCRMKGMGSIPDETIEFF